jgi:hypothetical protein
MTGAGTMGWAFLVARGRELGYQLLLAPDFLLAGRDAALLMDVVRGEVPASEPPVLTELAGTASGPVGVVYRTLRATARDLDGADRPAEPLLDRAGRPLVLTYGFVCRAGRVTGPDEDDLRVARDAALATYRRFLAAEESFLTRMSYPYALRSTVSGGQAGPAAVGGAPAVTSIGSPAGPAPAPAVRVPAAAVPAPAPWSADALPGPRRPAQVRRPGATGAPGSGGRWAAAGRPAPAPRRPAVLISLIAGLVLAGLVAGGYVLTQSHRPVLQASQVRVPNVVGQGQAAAARQLQRARLVPELKFTVSQQPAGIVIRTSPRAGTRVRSRGRVLVEVSEGTAGAGSGG